MIQYFINVTLSLQHHYAIDKVKSFTIFVDYKNGAVGKVKGITKIQQKTMTKLTRYTYRLSKRPLSNYGFNVTKEENYLPKINQVQFGSTAWLKLKKADKIMRINGRAVWNLDIDQTKHIIDDNQGALKITLRR